MGDEGKPRRWGKAGVRLSPQQVVERDRQALLRRARADEENAERLRVTYEKWAAGLVVPSAITTALDMHGLEGPGVDAACGVREPAVDLWEAGKLYPTWQQLLALAALTDRHPIFFVTARRSLSVLDTSMRFHLRPGNGVTAKDVRLGRYPDDVVARCPGTGWPPPPMPGITGETDSGRA